MARAQPVVSLPPGGALVRGLAPAVVLWAALVGWLSYDLYARAQWWREADQANLREWIDETRVFRKSLPELIKEYLALHQAIKAADPERTPSPDDVRDKADQIEEQLAALADATRVYQGQLPLFPEIYRFEVRFPDSGLTPLSWVSPSPPPRSQNQSQVQELDYPILGRNDERAFVRCEYRLHAFEKVRRNEEQRQQLMLVTGGLVLASGGAALIWVGFFLRRERRRELAQLLAEQQAEHARRMLLERELELSGAQHARDVAEREALELKSQLYASIGIMAGSYAHNIKNLLVRPNDLLTRCLEGEALAPSQQSMLHEVRSTLGTVTERLQQILRTVRRDPSRSEITCLDLAAIARDTVATWAEMAHDKWKLTLTSDAPQSVWVTGDLSHIQQAVENLLFNARDATFEMRNHLREQARRDPSLSADARRQAILAAAAWKGEVVIRVLGRDGIAILEVRDNGVGMTDDVRLRCTQAHFTTKRDNALYEGLSAGMGLGLSFVTVVLQHHHGELEIDSEPFKGAIFRMRLPLS
jgi:signal transduction histidine kinase